MVIDHGQNMMSAPWKPSEMSKAYIAEVAENGRRVRGESRQLGRGCRGFSRGPHERGRPRLHEPWQNLHRSRSASVVKPMNS
jgi:hypothetical protein